jgi:MFS family permease
MALLPIMAAVLAGFVVIGAALPVLPLHVSHHLGFGSVVVGVVAGAQFVASLISRVWSGSYSDANGGKPAVLVGLVTAAVAGLLYLLSVAVESSPVISVSILVIGRAVLGGAESFIITGGVAWGLALVDTGHSGKVIAWVGTAMFAALALSGPFGTMLFTAYGFAAIGLLTALLPLLVLASLLRASSPQPRKRMAKSGLGKVIGAVWLPGVGAAFSSIGYCSILAFSSLLYADHQWQPVWLGFTAFGAALIVARVTFGHVPDRFGGAKTALLFVLVQSAGLLIMGFAGSSVIASSGAALAGLGYSLVYPGLGVEAVGGTSPENRGLAMGIYTAFVDVAMAIGSPALGWVADREGMSAVFIVSAVITLCAAAVACRLLDKTARPR